MFKRQRKIVVIFLMVAMTLVSVGYAKGGEKLIYWNMGPLRFDPGTVFRLGMLTTHTDIDVTVFPIEYPVNEQKIATALMAGANAFDVAEADPMWVAGYIPTGLLEPLDDVITKAELGRIPEAIRRAMYGPDGHIYGIWSFLHTWLVYYNTEILKEAGIEPPAATWDELLLWARKTTKDIDGDGRTDIWGFPIFLDKDIDSVICNFGVLLYANGGKFLDEQGNPAIQTKAAVDALQFLVDVMYTYKVSPMDALNWAQAEPQRLFRQGKAAMTFVAAANGIDMCLYAEDSVVADIFTVSVPPLGSAGVPSGGAINGALFIVPINAPHKQKAKEFIKFMTNYDNQVYMLLYEPGNQVQDPTAYDDPRLRTLPFRKTLKEAMRILYPTTEFINPGVKGFREMMIALDKYIAKAVTGQMTAKEALAAATAEWKRIQKK